MNGRPLVVRTGAFGDMVLLTALIRALHARFGGPVDLLTSGPWSEPLLRGQPGVGDILTVRSRKTPYWLASDQRRAVRRLRMRGARPTWYCDAGRAARPMLARAGIADAWIVDVKDHPLLPDEHATEQWLRLARMTPRALPGGLWQEPAERPGCYLEVGDAQRVDLARWLGARGLHGPLLLVQAGNKRTMRRGLRRLAVNNKYWPLERWGEVIRYLHGVRPTHQIVLLGTGPEYALNQEIATHAGVAGLCNAADDLPIPRLVALLSRAAALITVDSGPAHAAAAVGCPQVVLFGKALPSLYRPRGIANAEVTVLCGRLDGAASMLGISAREVIDAFSALKLRA